jgi:Leucine-rich repeat (LRR) protein
MSIETEQYLRLKNKIYSDLSTKNLSINHWEKLKEIPSEINLLQQLESLSIYKNKSIKKYPLELADLPNLKHVSLRFNNLKQIPIVFKELKQLETLVLSNNRFLASTKWEYLTQMQALKFLDLSYSLQNLSTLPKEIGCLRNLRELNISGNKLKELPTSLKNLTQLEKLHCELNDFESFPMILVELPQLKELQISAKSLEGLPKDVLKLQHIETLKFTAKSTSKTAYIFPFERLLKYIKTHQFSTELQLFFLDIIRGSILIKDLTNQQLLTLLNCAIPEYINQALEEVEIRIKANELSTYSFPKANDRLVIKGKIKGKVSELKSRLGQNAIQTGVKINAATTHVLIGSMPGEIYEKMQEYDISLVTEQSLVQHLNQLEQPYLLASKEVTDLESIRQLLHSDQAENTLLALEMLKSGGVPPELLTELFLIHKLTRVQKIKRVIYQIVGQYAPLSFVTALKSRKPIGPSISETVRSNNLEYYCKIGDLDKKYIAFYLLKKGGYGHLFALFNLTTTDKATYFEQRLEEGHLSLSGLDLSHLPDDLGAIKGLTHLDISYNKFTSVPSQLFHCKELKNLYIRGLHEIHKKPDELWNIPNLEIIYVGYNNKWIGANNANSVIINGKTVVGR